MKIGTVMNFSLASAHGSTPPSPKSQVPKKKFQNRFSPVSKEHIVPKAMLSETVRFDEKYSVGVRLGLLACGTLLSWACVFGVARLILN